MKTCSLLRFFQLFWSFFIGIGALWGCVLMFFMPEFLVNGSTSLLVYMQVLPWPEVFFQSFTFPAICLFCANGLTNFIAIVLIFRRSKYGPLAGMLCGIVLMLWICVQFVIFPRNFLSITYFIFGALQAINGFAWYRVKRARA